MKGKHIHQTGRQRQATYATICQWIVDVWAKVSVSTVVRAFTKAGIITELPGKGKDTDSDNDEKDAVTRTPKMKNLRDLWMRNELKI